MSSNPRGKCIIINNSDFGNEAYNRHGAEFDEEKLVNLFKELFFDVDVRPNLSANAIRGVAIEVAARDHSAFDAFVFIIMSHGNDRDIIYGVDARYVQTEELMSEFKANKCPTLQNKPKLFIVQACRGSSQDLVAPANHKIDLVSRGNSTDSTLARGTCPQEADFLLAYGAAPGYTSYRNPGSGSLFIQVLVDVIRTHHRDSHLSELLQEVTSQLAEREIPQGGPNHEIHALQVPAHSSSTLRKKLYL
ncbi:Caspase-7 [Desmophyllum pertusum]|uniref:Caspase-7 n=1 Tax=Desmophyllum pertusum TaxID=174260 RepID=A0A9X0A1Y9_9CNID|nr:Caspase-7 [Desmophyllum pertusum]